MTEEGRRKDGQSRIGSCKILRIFACGSRLGRHKVRIDHIEKNMKASMDHQERNGSLSRYIIPQDGLDFDNHHFRIEPNARARGHLISYLQVSRQKRVVLRKVKSLIFVKS